MCVQPKSVELLSSYLRDRRDGDTGVLGRSIAPPTLLRPINQIKIVMSCQKSKHLYEERCFPLIVEFNISKAAVPLPVLKVIMAG